MADRGPRLAVFDLETMRSASEVGGWDKAYLMGMSVGIVWDSHLNDFSPYFENEVEALIEHLRSADLVIGFNIAGFDYSVLKGYTRLRLPPVEHPGHPARGIRPPQLQGQPGRPGQGHLEHAEIGGRPAGPALVQGRAAWT